MAVRTRKSPKKVTRKAPARAKRVVAPAEPRIPTAKLAAEHSRFFDIRKSGIQGRGAFATRRIRSGQRIIEYTGERISDEEADRRYDESLMKRHHTFLFSLTARKVVDGAINGNESIYINHSCDPNCEAIIEDGRIWIHALRTIQPGEELVYDYQYERTGDEDEDELERFYKCRCGAPNCRGSIMKPAPRRNKRGTRRVKR